MFKAFNSHWGQVITAVTRPEGRVHTKTKWINYPSQCMQSLSDHRGYSVYEPRWLSCKTNNENLSGKGKKKNKNKELVKSCTMGWKLGKTGGRTWKHVLWFSCKEEEEWMYVNKVDGQDAVHFAQVKYADLQRYARPTVVKSQGWWNCSQSYAMLTYVTASEIKSRQKLRIITL